MKAKLAKMAGTNAVIGQIYDLFLYKPPSIFPDLLFRHFQLGLKIKIAKCMANIIMAMSAPSMAKAVNQPKVLKSAGVAYTLLSIRIIMG